MVYCDVTTDYHLTRKLNALWSILSSPIPGFPVYIFCSFARSSVIRLLFLIKVPQVKIFSKGREKKKKHAAFILSLCFKSRDREFGDRVYDLLNSSAKVGHKTKRTRHTCGHFTLVSSFFMRWLHLPGTCFLWGPHGLLNLLEIAKKIGSSLKVSSESSLFFVGRQSMNYEKKASNSKAGFLLLEKKNRFLITSILFDWCFSVFKSAALVHFCFPLFGESS